MTQRMEKKQTGSHKVQKQFNGHSTDENLTQQRGERSDKWNKHLLRVYYCSSGVLRLQQLSEEDKKVGRRCWNKGKKE